MDARACSLLMRLLGAAAFANACCFRSTDLAAAFAKWLQLEVAACWLLLPVAASVAAALAAAAISARCTASGTLVRSGNWERSRCLVQRRELSRSCLAIVDRMQT